MANDGFTTQDLAFCVAMMYTFGDEALTKIEPAEDSNSRRRAQKFVLDIPSLDAAEYFKEFHAGTFGISNLLAYIKTYNNVIQILKEMHKRGETEWSSPSWIAGRKSTGARIR